MLGSFLRESVPVSPAASSIPSPASEEDVALTAQHYVQPFQLYIGPRPRDRRF